MISIRALERFGITFGWRTVEMASYILVQNGRAVPSSDSTPPK